VRFTVFGIVWIVVFYLQFLKRKTSCIGARIAMISPLIGVVALLFSSAASAADKADAEAQLIEHITRAKKAKFPE
jgi:hypothetical protein